MNRPDPDGVLFSELIRSLAAGQVWEYDCGTKRTAKDVAGQTHAALNAPIDFPPIESAIVAGDRIALAVDPNVPQLNEVITGILKTLAETQAGDIDIVLWDEVCDQTLASLKDIVGESATIIRHDSIARESLRYLGADNDAAPIYLSRALVDADFVLPVVSSRPMDAVCGHDLTGVFPSLADSATRMRHHARVTQQTGKVDEPSETQVAWLLGVHLILTVMPNASGQVGEILVGTPDAIGKKITPTIRQPDQFPPSAPLVIASLDGTAQQQTWSNAARALVAASRYAESGAAIVLWSEIETPPIGVLAGLADIDENELRYGDPTEMDQSAVERAEFDGFPYWDESIALAASIARIASEHRILIHSRLDRETVEPMGVGAIGSRDELVQLTQSFESCGVLRAAQFAGSTIDAPHRMGIES